MIHLFIMAVVCSPPPLVAVSLQSMTLCSPCKQCKLGSWVSVMAAAAAEGAAWAGGRSCCRLRCFSAH